MALTVSPTLNSRPFHDFDRKPETIRMEPAKSQPISLPSISSLIEAANEASEHVEKSPKEDVRRTSGSNYFLHQDRQVSAGSPRHHDPTTPTLADFPRHSPPTQSPSMSNAPAYYAHHASTTDPELYRQSAYPPLPDESGQWQSQQFNQSPTEHAAASPVPRSAGATYPDLPEEKSVNGVLPHQQPLPDNFPPPLALQAPGAALPPIDPQMAPPQVHYYQHHHGFPQTTTQPYQQSQDRYVCSICNKAFSRPSSLKIHTYSHTGEKPYKCKVEGCNKWFSVRSNMKRHEKGCHGASGPSSSTNTAQSP